MFENPQLLESCLLLLLNFKGIADINCLTRRIGVFFNKLGDLSKMASQAKEIQKNQERQQNEQIEILHKISKQLEEAVSLLK